MVKGTLRVTKISSSLHFPEYFRKNVCGRMNPFRANVPLFQCFSVIWCKRCLKSVRIWSFFGPYSVLMRENTDQKNSEYEHFPRSEAVIEIIVKSELNRITDTNSKLNMIKQKHIWFFVFVTVRNFVKVFLSQRLVKQFCLYFSTWFWLRFRCIVNIVYVIVEIEHSRSIFQTENESRIEKRHQ